MNKYVLIYLYNSLVNGVVAVNKLRPDNLKGKINLIGGKIEKGEYPIDAAHRELKEETGFEAILHRTGYMHGNGWEIYVFSGRTSEIIIRPGEDEEEIPYWIGIEELLASQNIIEELKIVIPLLKCNVSNWFLEEVNKKQFTIRLS